MGERSGQVPNDRQGGGGGMGGEIDWSAVFDGLATATSGPSTFPRALQPNNNDNIDPNLEYGNTTSVWDHLFPPPIPAGVGRTEPLPLSTASSPRGMEAGPSRGRGVRGAYPYSAPITPNPQYTNQSDFFARLSQSVYGNLDVEGAVGQGGQVPPPAEPSLAHHLELEERLRRNNDLINNQACHEDVPDLSPWQLPSPNTANFALDLPPPHPSFRNNARGRTQSLSTWQNYALAGPSSIPASFTPPDAPTSSNESTPALHPPGTPLLPVGVSTPGMTLDTEDKRQRNTLASAKFRAKRKKHMSNISQRIVELESEQSSLTRDVSDLKQENKFLREMVEIKYGLESKPKSPLATAQRPATSPSYSPNNAIPSTSIPSSSTSHNTRHQHHPHRPAQLHLQPQAPLPPPLPGSLPPLPSHLGYGYPPADDPPLTGGISSASTLASLLNAQGEWDAFQSQTQYETNNQAYYSPTDRFIGGRYPDGAGGGGEEEQGPTHPSYSYRYHHSHRQN